MKAALLGLLYVFLCLVPAVIAGGAGHGIMTPLILLCGPASYLESFAALLWPVVVWPLTFYLTLNHSRRTSVGFLLLMESIVLATLTHELMSSNSIDWHSRAVQELWPAAAASYVAFAAGQVFLWIRIVGQRSSSGQIS